MLWDVAWFGMRGVSREKSSFCHRDFSEEGGYFIVAVSHFSAFAYCKNQVFIKRKASKKMHSPCNYSSLLFDIHNSPIFKDMESLPEKNDAQLVIIISTFV